MSDKKIVDDYYSQNQTSSSSQESQEKKPKIAIKGKIKPKKESEKEMEVQVKEEKRDFPKAKKTQVFKKPLEEIAQTQTSPKKEYFTKKGQEEKELLKKNSPSQEGKKEYNKPQQDKRTSSSKPGNYSTSTQTTQVSAPTHSGNNTRTFDDAAKKEGKFVVKPKQKAFGEKRDDEAPKKVFKKDKSSKYSKNLLIDEDDFSFSRSNKIKNLKKEEKNIEDIIQNLTDRTGETVVIPDILSVKELSEKIGVPLMKLITEFMKNGMKVTINSKVDYDTASIISEAFKIKLHKDNSAGFGVEDMLSGDISTLLVEEDKDLLESRAPIISIMGHVDHGKTSLLDYLRKTKIADKEAGGITQSIGAYQVEYNNQKITFLDTPGHEAFTIMRARGAKSTDIAILVVAADEGVKPQTVESINHAREAELKVVVAITKIDKEGANIDNVKSGLSSHGLLPEDWGGDVPMVGISSKTGAGIDELLEIILLVAEIEQLQANPNRPAVGTVLESHLDTKLGPVSTILINTGTLKKGDSIVCKGSYGKVKVMKSDIGKNIDEASPSTPVLVVGFDAVCEGGDIVQVVSDIEKARVKALEYKELMSSKKAAASSSIDMIMLKIKSGNLKQLKVVVKADTNGSLEAIKGALLKLSTDEIKVTIIHSGVGNITEGDVLMCQGSSALLIGFNVDLLGNTKNIIEDTKIEYISSKIIYHITERVEKIVTGMLDPKEVETVLGQAEVGGIFYEGDAFMILGLKLKSNGKIERGVQARIIRKDKFLGIGKIENLKSGIIDVVDIEGPTECGIKLKTDVKVELGDILEIFKVEIQK